MTDFAAAFARIDRFVEHQMRADNLPGLALALTDRDRLLHVAAYGFADLAAQSPVTPDTLFEIGSIGKSFTAVALLQLHDEGNLDLHAPVPDHLHWFEVKSDHAPITVHHLLTHTAGIIAGTDWSLTAPSEVWGLRDTETGGPPGERFHYSNVGYKLLGLVLQRLTGEPYPATLQRRILDPLGMTASAPAITHDTRPRLAVGYAPAFDDRPFQPGDPLAPATWIETDTADGSIAATAADMAAFVRMLLNRGRGPNGPILSAAAFDLFSQRAVSAWDDVFYGYGLYTVEDDNHTLIGHDGGMVGFVSSLLADVESGVGAVVLVNNLSDPDPIAHFAVSVLRATQDGTDLPALPDPTDPTRIANAADYAGTFTAPGTDSTLAFTSDGDRRLLDHAAGPIPLERWADDAFLARHPAFARFPLAFARDGERVVELAHGPDWYVADAYAGPTTFDHPPAWTAYPSHYRSHNPWISNFRVLLRKGTLWLAFPAGPDGFADEERLVPLGDNLFRVGDDPANPERLSFDAIVDNQALRATLSGCSFFRFFTP